jgi:hypothetical protein
MMFFRLPVVPKGTLFPILPAPQVRSDKMRRLYRRATGVQMLHELLAAFGFATASPLRPAESNRSVVGQLARKSVADSLRERKIISQSE